ncbi:putative metal-binding motif-containing protein [Chondromyces apiculatus]|uniref:putative metal-binding motif-containing protein n=1 Tax=Chondromyces apiculatus TaxID=51 RepID=UPI001E3F0161|nr:putative metal-binding motif-containing protein [Chondromyces apiculatus]
MWTWGQNSSGQLGLGATTPATSLSPQLAGVLRTFYYDSDVDGFGDVANFTDDCTMPEGYVEDADDCNDFNESVHPAAEETCNGLDDNCNDETDESTVDSGGACDTGQQGICALGAGVCQEGILVCVRSHQPSPESCDGLDNDCDGVVDEDNPGGTVSCALTGEVGACAEGVTYCTHGEIECAPLYLPGPETCDGMDNDCNGVVDEGVKSTFYRDADGDSYGNPALPAQACSAPAGYVANANDCNDSNAGIKPGATEICDGVDNNCANGTNDEVRNTYYRDADGDGYGVASPTTHACSKPAGYAQQAGDCNDNNSSVYPNRAEVCGDGTDNNCNGQNNEGCQAPVCTSGTKRGCCKPCAAAPSSSLTASPPDSCDPLTHSCPDRDGETADILPPIYCDEPGTCSDWEWCVAGQWNWCGGGTTGVH